MTVLSGLLTVAEVIVVIALLNGYLDLADATLTEAVLFGASFIVGRHVAAHHKENV